MKKLVCLMLSLSSTVLFASPKECVIKKMNILAAIDRAENLITDELYIKGYSFDKSDDNGLALSMGIQIQGATQKQVQGKTQERVSIQGPTHQQVQGKTQERVSIQGPTHQQVQGETQERVSIQGPTHKQVQGKTQERVSIQGPTHQQVQGKTHTDKLDDLYDISFWDSLSSHVILTNKKGEDIFGANMKIRSSDSERQILQRLVEMLPNCDQLNQ